MRSGIAVTDRSRDRWRHRRRSPPERARGRRPASDDGPLGPHDPPRPDDRLRGGPGADVALVIDPEARRGRAPDRPSRSVAYCGVPDHLVVIRGADVVGRHMEGVHDDQAAVEALPDRSRARRRRVEPAGRRSRPRWCGWSSRGRGLLSHRSGLARRRRRRASPLRARRARSARLRSADGAASGRGPGSRSRRGGPRAHGDHEHGHALGDFAVLSAVVARLSGPV